MPDNPELPIDNDQTRAEPVDRKTGDLTLAERIARDHPDWPPIKLKFYFSSHANALDMAGLKDQLQGANIYFYENTSGNILTDFLQHAAIVEHQKASRGDQHVRPTKKG